MEEMVDKIKSDLNCCIFCILAAGKELEGEDKKIKEGKGKQKDTLKQRKSSKVQKKEEVVASA